MVKDISADFTARITGITPRSFAARCGIRTGDELVSINAMPVRDVIDVQVYSAEPTLNLSYLRQDKLRSCRRKRRYGETLGLEFESELFDSPPQVCHNNCDFCFVEQMAPNLRAPLYFKDDDYRLSFLHGNYITLTNLKPGDWERISTQYLSPLYISVHATEADVRIGLMHNPRAGEILSQLQRLADWGIEMHTQAVLAPGRNDDDHLDRTIADLAALYPAVRDVSIVPVGLTRWHRPDMRVFTAEEAQQVLAQCRSWRAKFQDVMGINFVYPTDEWYLLAGETVPLMDAYDDRLDAMIENGVGMVRQFLDHIPSLTKAARDLPKQQIWVTGTLFADTLRDVVTQVARDTHIDIHVLPVVNRQFGETVTVAGLLTATDIANALQVSQLQGAVLLPEEIFRGPDGLALDNQPVDLIRAAGYPDVYSASITDAGWVVKPA